MAQIIDADGHVVEPPSLWEEYTEPAFRDRMIQVRRSREGKDELWIEGKNRSSPALPVSASMIPGGLEDLDRARKFTWDDVLSGSYDPRQRLRVMDEERIDVAVLYPSLLLLYGDIDDPKVAAAACRAYSNWLADFCKASPKRLYGVAPMPLQSVDESIKEMRRVVKELNFKAVFIRPNPFNGRRLNDPAYDSFWREAQELDVPVAVHGSFGTRMPTMGADRYRDPFFFHMICHPFEQQAACMDIVCGGVLAKFPGVRVAFLESGIGWLGYWLDRMDSHFEKMGAYVPWLKKPPREYFLEQCYLTMDADESTLAAMVDIGVERNVLWGSDYPHFDCTYPGVLNEVDAAIAGLPAHARQNILTDNALRFYKF
jgi:predicted TIM-barrel fold metal-dependent hydrolase